MSDNGGAMMTELKPCPIKFRKRPVVIDAIRWDGRNLREVINFTGWHESASSKWTWEEYEEVVRTKGLKIFTLEGHHMASVGDWIIRGVKGEFYPCKPDIFAQTYEPVAAPTEREAALVVRGIDYATAKRLVEEEWGSVVWFDCKSYPATGVVAEFVRALKRAPADTVAVPREPTKEMLNAAINEWPSSAQRWYAKHDYYFPRKIYKAMLAARPEVKR